jgi:transposase
MNSSKNPIIAIDIAKDSLDVRSEHLHFETTNCEAGFKFLIKGHQNLLNPMIVCEASGGYERELLDYCHAHGITVSLVRPSLIRHYAKSQGIHAKTDAIDSKMILQYAQHNRLKPTRPADPREQKLAALMDRRAHLTEMIAREKNRLQKSPASIQASIKRIIKALESELEQIETSIRDLIAENEKMHEKSLILQSVTGVGETTAWNVLAYMNELGSLKRNQIVALAGIAPFNKDTGKTKGKRRIIGGRAKVRSCLYMAAQTAATHNPEIREYVKALRSRGKPYKCAMVAAMRKLLIHLHILIKNYELSLA